MHRRRAVALTGSGALVGLAGCSRLLASPPRGVPDGMAVETRHWSERVLTFSYPSAPADFHDPNAPERDDNHYGRLRDRSGGERAARRRRVLLRRGGARFVEATDFDRSYLVDVDWGSSPSSATLEIHGVTRTDDGLHLSIGIEQPAARTDDASIHTLAVRTTDRRDHVPETVSADIYESEVRELTAGFSTDRPRRLGTSYRRIPPEVTVLGLQLVDDVRVAVVTGEPGAAVLHTSRVYSTGLGVVLRIEGGPSPPGWDRRRRATP